MQYTNNYAFTCALLKKNNFHETFIFPSQIAKPNKFFENHFFVFHF
jgi:hypothetical protein